MSGNTPLRIGIQSVATLTASLTAEQSLSAALGVVSEVKTGTRPAPILQAIIPAGAFAFSTLYGVQGETGAFVEAYWPLKIAVGVLDDVVVKYVDVEVAGLSSIYEADALVSFETINKNLHAANGMIAWEDGEIASITYANGIVKTFTYGMAGLQTIALSGATPAGIDHVKTLIYSGTDLTGVTYA